MRKSFRKVLYKSNVDNDFSEALMGHRLQGSKENYFDNKDIETLAKMYSSYDWGRGTEIPREFKDLEAKYKELEEKFIKVSSELKHLSQARARGGPCPPSGTHRYFFKVYALDAELDLNPNSRKRDVERAMKGHIIAQGELIGLYKRR